MGARFVMTFVDEVLALMRLLVGALAFVVAAGTIVYVAHLYLLSVGLVVVAVVKPDL